MTHSERMKQRWQTPEFREKMLANLRYHCSQPRKNKVNRPPHSEETKEKIRKALTGYKHSTFTKIKMGNSRRGKKHTEEAKFKIGENQTGSLNKNWKGGVSWQFQMKNHPDYEMAMSFKTDRCDICGVHQGALKRKLSFDHCHRTGRFRGWLCGKCNSGLGLVGDSVAVLEAMISYIKKNTI